MKLRFIYISLFLFSCTVFSSQPVNSTAHKIHEESETIQRKNETSISIEFFASSKHNAKDIGTIRYSFCSKKKKVDTITYATKTGLIEIVEVCKEFRNKGYGTLLFKKAIIGLTVFKPRSICWEAQPLDDRCSEKDLLALVRFYRRYGSIIIKKHINHEENFVDMKYPMALAYTLAILHPIFETQQKSPIIAHIKQEDPFALIVAYANMDLKNKDFEVNS